MNCDNLKKKLIRNYQNWCFNSSEFFVSWQKPVKIAQENPWLWNMILGRVWQSIQIMQKEDIFLFCRIMQECWFRENMTLSFDFLEIWDLWMEYLSALIKKIGFKKWMSLSLVGTKLSVISIKYLAEAILQARLQEEMRFDFTINNLGPEGMEYLCRAMPWFKKHLKLRLRACKIGDQGAEMLANLIEQNWFHEGLEINLINNGITRAWMVLLLDAIQQKKLKKGVKIFLWTNPGLSDYIKYDFISLAREQWFDPQEIYDFSLS